MYLCAQNHDLKRGGTFETAKAGTFHSVTAGTSIPLFTYKFIDRAIKSKCLGILEACREDDIIAPPEHENIRGLFV